MSAKALVRFAAGVMAAALLLVAPARSATWDEDYFPNYTVYDQDGNSYKFYDDLVRGKIVVANFIYTTCTDICGLATARMAEVVEGIGDRMGKEIFVYSITLTPEIDTPESMKKFATAFGEVDGWKFLTGDPAEMKDLRWKLGERSRYLGEHRSDMVIGNDIKGFWRRISLMGNLRKVTEAILRLDPAYANSRDKVARLGDQNRYIISNRPGEALFMKGCSGCHNVGGGDRIGPDLYGVTWKRKREWLVRVLLEPNKLRQEGDPLFTALDAQYPNVLMPYLDLSETDAHDVLEYLERRSVEIGATQDPDHHDHKHHDHHDHGHETGDAAGADSHGAAARAGSTGAQPNG